MRALKFLFAILVLWACGSVRSEFFFAGKEARLRVADPSAQFIVNSSLFNFCGTLQKGVARADQLQGKASILFKGGQIEDAKSSGTFSGEYDPLASDVIRLSGNHSLSLLNGGPVLTPIMVLGVGNEIEGFAAFSDSIFLQDVNTSVTLSLISPLSQSVVMNGGLIVLGLDLDLVQDGIFVGNGIVDCQKNALRLNQRATIWSGALTLKNVGVLQLRGPTTLTGTWTFTSTSSLSIVNGDNNVLDLSSGGKLVIGPGDELVLINVILRGLGEGYGSIHFSNGLSKLTLIGCTLELSSSYTLMSGVVVIKEQSSLAVVGENCLAFDGDARLHLDGTDFVYDALMASNLIGIRADDAHLIVRGGKILARVQDANGPAMLFSHRSNVLLKSEVLSPSRTMSFGLTGTESVYLDGGGFSLRLPQVKKGVISVADGQTVVLKNMVLEGFYPEHISFGVGSRLVFGDNVFILLAGDATLSYQMMFGGNATLSGAGNVLSLTRTGTICAGSGKTLRLIDIVVKGIATNGGQIVHEDATSVISCVDVDLQIDSNYSFSVGKMVFLGAQSRIITGPNTLTFNGTANLTVDGVSLFYDTLASPDGHNIKPWLPDGETYIALNGGKIRSISSLEKEGDLLLDLRSNVLNQAEALSLSRRMLFRGQRAFGSTIDLDGSGFVVQMPRGQSSVIVIPDGKTVTLKNMVLRDFAPEHVLLGVGSALSFGDGILLQLSDDCILTSTWRFSGKAVIDGRYKNLELGKSTQAGIVLSQGSTLRIVNANITGLSDEKLRAEADDCCLELSSSVLQMNSTCTFALGSVDIYNDVSVTGAGSLFLFDSSGAFTIKRGAQFSLDSDVTFKYDALNQKNSGFVFENETSRLSLHNARLLSGRSGLALDKGIVVISGVSSFDTEGVSSLLISDTVQVKVQVGATLDLLGTIFCG